MAPAPTSAIVPESTAEQVRRELFAITGQERWNDSKYWTAVFLKGRTAIFDDLPKDGSWLHPTIAKDIDEKFVSQAKVRWQGGIDEWILEGDWLDTRDDIVAWLRIKYWKNYQRRPKESLIPLLSQNQTTSKESDGCVGTSEANAQVSQQTCGKRSWQDVMLDKQPDNAEHA